MGIDRRRFLTLAAAGGFGVLTTSSPTAHAFGPSSLFGVGRLQYEGNWDPRPTGLPRMLQQLESRTSILADMTCPVAIPTSPSLFDTPFVVWCGDRGFDPLPDAARRNLELYLRAGGTILIDSSEGNPEGEFDRSVRREMRAILPHENLARIPRSHVVFKSFYLIDDPPGRVMSANYMEGIEQDGRLMVIYSHNDLLGAWARDNFGNWLYEVTPGGERQRELAFRMGINIAMYVLCLDYKEDQVHVRFILHRRQWRID